MWYIYITLLFLNLLAAGCKWRNLQPAFRITAVIILSAVFTELLKRVLSPQAGRVAEHIYLIASLPLWAWYYHFALDRKKGLLLFATAAAFFTAIFVLWSVEPYYLYEFGYTDYIFLAICISFWSALFFYELLHKPIQYSLKADGHFWINCGNLLFYPGNLLLLGYCAYLERVNPVLYDKLRIINRCSNLLLYTLYLAGFLAIKKAQERRDRKNNALLLSE